MYRSALRAAAPIQHHLSRHADVESVLDDALDRREAGAAGEQDHRLVAVLAQKERAERSLEAQDVALLHLVEHVLGERAAGHVADVQFDVRLVLRRVRHRIGAALAVAQDDLDVLAGQKLQPFVGRQVEIQRGHVVRGRSIFCTRHGSFLIWISPAALISRASITRSVSGLAWQNSAKPVFFS